MRSNMPTVLDKCEVMFRCAEPVSRSMKKARKNKFINLTLVVWKEVLAQFEQMKSGLAKVESELVHYPPESSREDQFRAVMAESFLFLF